MEIAVNQRTVVRRLITKNCNLIDGHLDEKEATIETQREITAKLEYVEELVKKMIVLDEIIQKEVMEGTDFEDKLEKDMEDAEKYKTRWRILSVKARELSEKKSHVTTNPKQQSPEKIKHCKLPKLELKKFDGNIRSWLPFWGQFQKVDADPNIDTLDKFQYLIQCTEANSELRNFVESFPLSEKSYVECITELKERYAREDLLIQIYVRELLSIILQKREDKKINITTLYDKINAQLRALDTLGVTKEKFSDFLLPMIESALPSDILKIWERNKLAGKSNLQELMRFMKNEVDSEQRVKLAKETFSERSKEKTDVEKEGEQSEPTAGCLLTSTSNGNRIRTCVWCDKDTHGSLECHRIAKLTLEQRREHLRKKKACPICLRVGHHPKACKVFIQCFNCKRRHSVALCPGTMKDNEKPKEQQATTVSAQCAQISNVTLLQTLKVKVCYENKSMTVRALIDSGAQRSYVKEDIVKNLGISFVGKETLTHSLFGGVEVGTKDYNVYNLNVCSLDDSFGCSITALGQNCIANNIPKFQSSDKCINDLLLSHNISLTDQEGGEIGLLIGADYSGLIMSNIMVHLKDMLAIKTKLGWVLQGKQACKVATNCMSFTLFCSSDVTGYWSLEALGIRDPVEVKSKAQAEVEAVLSFEENIRVNEEGRYETALPWKSGYEELTTNRDLATRRLEATTKRLKSSGKLGDYDSIFKDWLKLGIIETVVETEGDRVKRHGCHYLPHRGVVKESSLTTKLRPVFDASARDYKGMSLNSYLNTGVNFLDKIPNLLMGFRKRAIGVTADIAKAFLMISVTPSDRDYLRFLWWEDMNCNKQIVYRHCRVVFGLTSSPFLLSATINYHLRQIKGNLQKTAEVLLKSFYVDNCITSMDTQQQVQTFITEAKEVMAQAKFDLRQWVASESLINETGDRDVSVLGLLWDTETDELRCNFGNLPSYNDIGAITKRNIMSLTQRIFDPIGYTCPATLTPRLLLQECWRRKLTWDSDLPADLADSFRSWYEQVVYLKECRVPRRLTTDCILECNISFHMFCDASKYAYGACVFLRAENNGNVTVQLVSAKARVAPPEKMTIPRLELTAALIGSRLLLEAKKNLSIECEEYCWTDSCVALCWIKKELPWNTYVGNRVKEIRQNSSLENWYHIPGVNNWADVASRGCTPEQLKTMRWWEGPAWLRCDPEMWPKSSLVMDEKEVHLELKKTVFNKNICTEESVIDRFTHISKYRKIIRIYSLVRRYMYNLLHKSERRTGEITSEEYKESETCMLKEIQKKNSNFLTDRSSNINTFTDSYGMLRTKTKLLLSTEFSQNTRTPILLPACDYIVKKMVEQRHVELFHAGANQLISDLRNEYWIIGIRRLVKSVISACTICKRFRSKPVQANPAPLPVARMSCSAPFETTGIDLAGPLYLQEGGKCWIVLYTCAVYRAVHLELTKSLSAEAFILTLRRFIARRGRVKQIISDNGTNLAGTKHLLSLVDWQEVQKLCTIDRISWKLNAPTAAWWGGFWERLIRILKDLLRRILGKSQVSYDELQTVLCDCEAIMNSRPLTYVQDDQNTALEPLTPACFIQPLSQTDVTDLDAIPLSTRYKYLIKLRDDFKMRFKSEYLTSLIETKKDRRNNLKIGDVVLIETEEKRIKWPLGLIVEIFPGKDEVSRTAKVKTLNGFKIRPFQRLYPLEISSVDVEGLASSSSDFQNKKGESPSSSVPVDLTGQVNPEEPVTSSSTSRSGRTIKVPSRYRL